MLGANIYVQYNSYFTRTRLSFQTITWRFSMSTGFTEDMSEGHSQRLFPWGAEIFKFWMHTHEIPRRLLSET